MKNFFLTTLFFLLSTVLISCKKHSDPEPSAGMSFTVYTRVGNGTAGLLNGTGLNTSFNHPSGIAYENGTGSYYVADRSNHVIRKVTIFGEVSTYAGSGIEGHGDGTGTAAQFSYPTGIALDVLGNLYIADQGNHVIRKINSAGEVTTLAGKVDTSGYSDGRGSMVQFDSPSGVAMDYSGNLYVADQGNHKIRKIDESGLVTTVAGSLPGYVDATGYAAKFNKPVGLIVDIPGNVYVTDQQNYKIRKISPSGVVTTLAGSTPGDKDGEGTIAQFSTLSGITIDGYGALYVTDQANNKIRKINSSGYVSTFAGSGVAGTLNGPASKAQFYTPTSITIIGFGTFLVTDGDGQTIRELYSQ